ncbi:MAG: hypothetical protein DME20_03335 [Verrucomicrobia bacterium]|nr:MAG: hypothetical protein DME71_11800 [Verrucomicrobiota bacterium]PYK50886.1 MAG: hypothetical protein DME20_03335 [Verrucomicrobiota bacterium]PYL43782.1 MAG: hypothetical protein DMF42_02970 [Verrucomicrobiota bacterium]
MLVLEFPKLIANHRHFMLSLCFWLKRHNEHEQERHLQATAVCGKFDARAQSSGGGMADTYV